MGGPVAPGLVSIVSASLTLVLHFVFFSTGTPIFQIKMN